MINLYWGNFKYFCPEWEKHIENAQIFYVICANEILIVWYLYLQHSTVTVATSTASAAAVIQPTQPPALVTQNASVQVCILRINVSSLAFIGCLVFIACFFFFLLS